MRTETRLHPDTIEEASRWCNVHHGVFHDCEFSGPDNLRMDANALANLRAYVVWDLGPKYDADDFAGERPVHVRGSTGIWAALLLEIDRLQALVPKP